MNYPLRKELFWKPNCVIGSFSKKKLWNSLTSSAVNQDKFYTSGTPVLSKTEVQMGTMQHLLTIEDEMS